MEWAIEDTTGTVALAIADSVPVAWDVNDISDLYGFWVEDGKEDERLEELYKSR